MLEHDTLMVPDSASFDPASRRWMAARLSPVPAWRIAESFGSARHLRTLEGIERAQARSIVCFCAATPRKPFMPQRSANST